MNKLFKIVHLDALLYTTIPSKGETGKGTEKITLVLS